MIRSLETRFSLWMSAHSASFTQRALGIVFLWFGLLKFCHGLCDVELLAQKTLTLMTFGLFSPSACVYFLGLWECAMGLTLLFAPRQKRWGAVALKLCAISLLLHLAGTFLPLVLFPAETWKHMPYAPTLAGQYILKNVVLMAAAVTVAANASTRTRTMPLMLVRSTKAVAGPRRNASMA